MEARDLPRVAEIEREAFPTIWPPTSFRRELSNRIASYIVACQPRNPEELPAPAAPDPQPPLRWLAARLLRGLSRLLWNGGAGSGGVDGPVDPVWGFVGIWFMADEAHITSLATRLEHQRQGIGELLLIGTVELAVRRGSRAVTLEARASNEIAQALYRKYGFKEVGTRKRYYSDNGEDAVIMTTDPIASPDYQELFQGLVVAHQQRWGIAQRVIEIGQASGDAATVPPAPPPAAGIPKHD
jgi:ribosomal-protein-alanine N-acetyltransferase